MTVMIRSSFVGRQGALEPGIDRNPMRSQTLHPRRRHPARWTAVHRGAFRSLSTVLVAGVSMAATASSSTPSIVEARPAAASGEDLELFESLLLDAEVPVAFRQEAATRLMQSGSEDAAAMIGRAIEGGDDARRAIVIDALKVAGPLGGPVARVVVVAAADGSIPVDAAAAALAISGEIGTAEVVSMHRSEIRSDRRARVVEILGRLPDPVAAGVLVAAMEDAVDPEDIERIDRALQRWSNSSVSRTPVGWAAWWTRLNVAGDGSVALQRLTSRILQEAARADTEAARAIAAEERAERLARQLADAHARLLVLLPETERMARVQAMLVDPESRIRSAAIAQIERMLRDARALPEPLRRALLDRLADIDPAIRMKAAQVLDTMGGEELGPTLVRSLEGESDPEVVRAGLLVLGNRPQPSAAGFAVGQLSSKDPEILRLAARVLGTLSAADLLHPDDRELVRTAFAEGLSIDARETARLAVLVAKDPEDDAVSSLLDSELELVQRGAAEAMRTRGLRELLHAHAGSPAVARVAVQAWADPARGVDATSVERLLELRPRPDGKAGGSVDTDADFANWKAAMTRVLEAMPGSQVAAVADRLAGSREFLDARIGLLRRGADDPSLATPARIGLQRRLAGVLVEAGRPAEAVGELRAAGAGEPDSPLRGELFAALLRAADWSAAAEIEPDPGPWIMVLENRDALGEGGDAGIVAEIERRFADRLADEDRARLERERSRVVVEPEGSRRR